MGKKRKRVSKSKKGHKPWCASRGTNNLKDCNCGRTERR